MKEEKRLKILEFMSNAACSIENLLFIFTLPYGTSFSRMYREIGKGPGGSAKAVSDKKTRLKFNDLIYHLKKDGLIVKTKDTEFKITKRGLFALRKLKEKSKKKLPEIKYEQKKDNLLKIIIFDIPESEKRKREWLRRALKELQFKMLQKSVWAGKAALCPRFIEDLRDFNVIPYIEIFEISKSGSLRRFEN